MNIPNYYGDTIIVRMARFSAFLFVIITSLITITQIIDCNAACTESITTVSGPYAPKGKICSGDLIFEDNFDKLDLKIWQHENTLTGGGVSNFNILYWNVTNSYQA